MPATRLGLLVIFVAALALLAACGPQVGSAAGPAAITATPAASESGRVIVLGDIDPDEPVKKIERFTPLAQYLAGEMKDLGMVAGKVVIARDAAHMARLLREDKVDFYFDSAFPSLQVQSAAGAFSNLDYDDLVAEGQPFASLMSTLSVPRHLVSVRPGIEADLVERVVTLLTSLHQTEEGRELLASLKGTEKFDLVSDQSRQAMEEMIRLIGLVFPAPAE